ncbi:hypothetical protein PR048_017239, partial [Dryococelus australis]
MQINKLGMKIFPELNLAFNSVPHSTMVCDLVVCRHYVYSRKVEHFSSRLMMLYDGSYKILRFLGPVT